MSTIKTEPRHAGAFLQSEGPGTISRAEITLTGARFSPGQVVGQISESGHFTGLNPTASDGSQVASAIVYAALDATTTEQRATAVVRQAEVAGELLLWPKNITAEQQALAIEQLQQRTIILR